MTMKSISSQPFKTESIMKKVLLFAGLAAAALSFVGCNKEETDFAGNEGKLSIRFVTTDTKTTNDGLSTKWAKGDALTVFYAKAGTTEYSVNNKFSFADEEAAANGVATGDVQLESGSYDWYAIYPYSSKYSTPANTDTYATVGSSSSGSQTQNGLNSTAHLAGYNYPLAGQGTFASTAKPSIQMKQLTTVLAINVKNTTSAPIKVNSVSLTAPVDLVGGFFVDFSKATPAMVPEEGYTSKTAKVAVTGDNTLAAGASATFYMAVCPFTVSSADLTVKIIADEGTVEKTKTVSATFAAGHIKTLNVDFDNASGPAEIITATIEEFLAAAVSEDQWYQLTGTVSNIANTVYGNFDLTDETGKVYIYGLTKTKVAKNDKSFADLNIQEGDKITIISLRGEHNGTPQGGGNTNPAYFVSKEESTDPSFGVEKSTFEIAANVTSVTINVTGNVDWTTSVPSGVTLDKTSGTGAAAVTATFDANTSSEPKEYIIYFSTTAEGVENDEIDVTITQAGAFAGVTIDWGSYADWGLTLDADGNVVSNATITLTDGDYVVTIVKNNGSSNPFVHKTLNDARAYAKATVTVKNTKNVNMTSIIFNLSEQGLKRLAPITASVGDIATQTLGDKTVTWTGEATEVTFTVGEKAVYGSDGDTKSGQLDFTSINVVEGGQGTAKSLESITLSGQKTTFNVGDTFTFNGTVTASYSDGSSKTVTPTSVSTPDMTTAGTQEVTVTYTEGGVTKTASYTITVNTVTEPGHAGTLDDPYTVADAMAATTALGEGKTSPDSYYTKGIISQVDEVSADHGNATYFISDDGTTGSQFKVFRGKYIGNINFSATDQIKVGDEVIVYGKLTYYKPASGDSEIEIAQNNYIYSLKRGGSDLKAMSAVAQKTAVPAAASSVVVNVYGNVAWTASASNGATVSPASGNGIGTFTVNIPENTDTQAGKTYTVTVSGTGVETVTLSITQDKKDASGATTVNVGKAYLAANKDGSLDDVISYTNNSDYGTTVVTELRVYKGKTFTVSASNGHTIKSITMTCTANGVAKQGPGCWGAGAPEGYTFEADGKVGTWTGSASEVTFTATDNQVRIVDLTVVYE